MFSINFVKLKIKYRICKGSILHLQFFVTIYTYFSMGALLKKFRTFKHFSFLFHVLKHYFLGSFSWLFILLMLSNFRYFLYNISISFSCMILFIEVCLNWRNDFLDFSIWKCFYFSNNKNCIMGERWL